MILVDTSIWIDHLHQSEPALVALLEADEVGCHPLVIEELALESIRERATLLDLLASQPMLPVLSHAELLAMVDGRRLWGRGLSVADAHLLGAVALAAGARLWTRDKRLIAACHDLEIAVFEPRG